VSVVVVTQATHSDIPEICALYKRVWDDYKGKLPEELIKTWEPSTLEFTSWMEGVTYFAARKDKRVVGVVGCSLLQGAVQLVHLAVDPEARRAGIASSLVGACMEWARRAGAASLWVEAQNRFDGAIALFRKLGFTESGTLHKHFLHEDVHLYERVL
jgi:ribosomal protein S18 acetylase RimI-like enzyme